MNIKTIATASAALLFVTGAAFAQASGTGNSSKGGSGTQIGPFASEKEQGMYESNREALSGFFTDDTMTTLRSEEEMNTAWTGMDATQQASLRSACQQAMDDSGSYGASTSSICTNVMGR